MTLWKTKTTANPNDDTGRIRKEGRKFRRKKVLFITNFSLNKIPTDLFVLGLIFDF